MGQASAIYWLSLNPVISTYRPACGLSNSKPRSRLKASTPRRAYGCSEYLLKRGRLIKSS